MKKSLLYLFIILTGFNFQNKSNTKKWVIMSGCSLRVDGSTNVNNFSCAISNYGKPDTIVVSYSSNTAVQMNGNIKLDVENFDCHNPIMSADLRKTLKAKEFPNVIISFIAMSNYPYPAKQDAIKGAVSIVLAGVARRFDVDYRVVSAEGSFLNLIGSRRVNFSDFNLIPPRKLGGMIRTNNELSVVFNLKMKVLD